MSLLRRLDGRIRQRLDSTLYPNHQDSWDDALFRGRLDAILKPGDVVLDLGAGSGRVKAYDVSGKGCVVYGLDPDPRVVDNPHLDEGRVGLGDAIPWPDQTFDVVFCGNVLEHLEHPEAVFRELHRVLKPGGHFLFKTPNRSHYMPLVARITPTAFHKWFNARRGRDEEDTFPTQYLANSRSQIHRLAAESGLTVHSLELIEGRPEYLRMTTPTYLFGVAYERLVNSSKALAPFRILLIGCLRR